MRSTDYDDTIAAIEQEYSRGEYSDLDADPEAEARARSREEQEKLDKDRKRARGSRRLAEVAFTPAALPAHPLHTPAARGRDPAAPACFSHCSLL